MLAVFDNRFELTVLLLVCSNRNQYVKGVKNLTLKFYLRPIYKQGPTGVISLYDGGVNTIVLAFAMFCWSGIMRFDIKKVHGCADQ